MSELVESSITEDLPEPETDDGLGPSEEAPYGYFKNGKPRKHPPGGRATGSTRSVTVNQSELADKIVEYLGIPVSGFSPLAAAVIDDRAERTAKALMLLAGNSKRFARGLQLFMTGTAYGELIMFPLAVGFAVMVDMGRISPLAMPVQKFKITEFHMQLYPDEWTQVGNRFQWQPGMNGHVGESERIEPRTGF